MCQGGPTPPNHINGVMWNKTSWLLPIGRSDCDRFETVLVCPRRNAALCAEGPLCLPPRRPCPTGARAWLARWLPPWRHEAACDAAAARGRRELWLP